MNANSFLLPLVLFLSSAPTASASAPLWWSETMPHADHGGTRHAHGGPVEIRRGVYYKNLWLRAGNGPANSEFLRQFSGGKALLVDVKGEVKEIKGGDLHRSYGISFAMPDEGFYNLYFVNESVVDGTREITVAKSEVLKHSCREGHDHVKGLMAPRQLDSMPIEIVRERVADESFHTLLGFGDDVRFRVLREGKPLAGAEVTLHSARGWRNTVKSDADGRASFMLIRDYYPPWHEFERRHRQDYLVHAVYAADESGAGYNASRYVSTFNGSYYPSARDYRSYAYGLMVGLFALTATGVGVYLYRRRRQRRYEEVRFDEKN